jgi:hypothetical protein
MSIHSMTCVHPCPPILFKLHPCIQILCNVYYPPTPSLGWTGQIKGRSLSMALARSASWLAYSLHPRSLTPMRSWMHKTNAHPCPPMNNNVAPMPTQNPWAWVGMGMGMGTRCRALVQRPSQHTLQNHVVWSQILKRSVKSHVTRPSTKCYFN